MTKYDKLLQEMTFYSLKYIDKRINEHEREIRNLRFIKLVISGIDIKNASRMCGFSRQYGYKIIKKCIENRSSKRGRPCKLNSSEIKMLINYLNKNMPFSIKDVRTFLNNHNINYCDRQIIRIINGLGFKYCRLLNGYISIDAHKKLAEKLDCSVLKIEK